jgi:hypothetical protein
MTALSLAGTVLAIAIVFFAVVIRSIRALERLGRRETPGKDR